MDQDLPGSPRPRLVRTVRRQLASFGVRPTLEQWLLTWAWARSVAFSYSNTMWPIASEIAAQYMVLLLAEMRRQHALKLPYRAMRPDCLPDGVNSLVVGGVGGVLALSAGEDS